MKKLKMTCNVTKELKAAVDYYAENLDYKSASEFIAKTIEYYIFYLNSETTKDLIGDAVYQAVDSSIELHTDRLADIMFKYVVSIEKEKLFEEYGDEYDEDEIEEVAINNVRMRIGRL